MENTITIYQHNDYQGASQRLEVGSYDMSNIQIGNDQLSSIKVPAGLRATLCEHANFGGRRKVLTTDTPSMVDFNDLTSSIIVERVADPAPTKLDKFSLIISSDPQYPWYDGIPAKLNKDDAEAVKTNAARQIKEQYESMNALAADRKNTGNAFPVQGVLINGDLTAFGHGWQLDTYKSLVKTLTLPYYLALGNHDYANNVDDCVNNGCASAMVDYMYEWLQNNQKGLTNYDAKKVDSYKFPELRNDLTGSLSYSFNIGRVHFVQLQHYPSYTREWNSWYTSEARRHFFSIKPSFDWLNNDLAQARNRGDIIIISLHDYGDVFRAPEALVFDDIVAKYGVSAVFAGHIHGSCGQVSSTPFPFFRSGSASYQDYLVADIDVATKVLKVKKMACPENGKYAPTGEEWTVSLNDSQAPVPVPPAQGWVTFFHEGGYEAVFKLKYRVNGQDFSFETGTMRLGNKTTYQIPPTAEKIWIQAILNTGLVWSPKKTVFEQNLPSPPNKCYKIYGTTLNPKWDNK